MATVKIFRIFSHTLDSASQSAAPSESFCPSGNSDIKQWTFPREGSPFSQPSGHGRLPALENAECMEEDTLISLSATPSSENTSSEELRWKDYQAKQGAGSQMSLNMRPSGPFIVPKICNGDAADHSTPICKLWNNGASLAASSAGFKSWSFGPIQGTPNTTASPAESPSPSLSPLPQATPFPGLHNHSQFALQSTPVESPSPSLSPLPQATPFPGLHNQSQFALQSPFGSFSAAPGLSSGITSISSMSCPMSAASCVQAQSEKAYSLQWPQSSLQAPVLSMPSPSVTNTRSPAAASEDQNILLQRDPTPVPCANSYKIAAEMSIQISKTESGSLVQHGISSLPDAGCKYSHPRTISLLTSKQVFQKTVIRMQSRRHGGLKKDGPRVSFLNDYSDVEDYGKRDALPVARKNPKEFLLGTPWLDRNATRIGAQKDDSTEAT